MESFDRSEYLFSLLKIIWASTNIVCSASNSRTYHSSSNLLTWKTTLRADLKDKKESVRIEPLDKNGIGPLDRLDSITVFKSTNCC